MDQISEGILKHGSLEKYINFLNDQVTFFKNEYKVKQRAENQQNASKTDRPTSYKYTAYKNRAKDKGFEMNITIEDFGAILTLPCQYCGMKATTIDRINSNLGYVYGNVNPCCLRCNIMKNDLPLEQFLEHIKRVYKYSVI